MSGPSCKTCDWFRPGLLDGDKAGECGDPTKAIYYHCGDRIDDLPIVSGSNECSNHTGLSSVKDKRIAKLEARIKALSAKASGPCFVCGEEVTPETAGAYEPQCGWIHIQEYCSNTTPEDGYSP